MRGYRAKIQTVYDTVLYTNLKGLTCERKSPLFLLCSTFCNFFNDIKNLPPQRGGKKENFIFVMVTSTL